MKKLISPAAVLLLLSFASPSLAINSGFFPSVQIYPTLSQAEAVAIGDVNSDGRTDVVMTTGWNDFPAEDYKLFVYLQDGTGYLAAPVLYDVPIAAYGSLRSVDVGDLNGDGLTDVVVAASDQVGVFYQNAGGSLDPVVGYAAGHIMGNLNVQHVRIGDFNGDGRDDVVSLDWDNWEDAVDVYLQNAGGTLDPPVLYTVWHGGRNDLEVGDVNGDGLTDVIVMSGQGSLYDNVGILLQNAGGTFDPVVYYDLEGDGVGNGLAVGDLTGDGLDDVALSYGGNTPSSFVAVLPQNVSGTLDSPVSYPAYDIPGPAEVADVNFDGRGDLVVAHDGWEAVSVYLQTDGGTLMPFERYDMFLGDYGNYPDHGFEVGDISGDGAPDVVLVDTYNGLIVLYHSPPPTATFFPATGRVLIHELEILGTPKSFRVELARRPGIDVFDMISAAKTPRATPVASFDSAAGVLSIPELAVDGLTRTFAVELTLRPGECTFDLTSLVK